MRAAVAFAFFLVFISLYHPVFATEEYAEKTGRDCPACHVDPGGGSELTSAGKEFAATFAAQGEAKGPTVAGRALRLLAGYIHLLTAILWFGTILYVHLVLKPHYAAGGLPRGEVRVGVLSMIVVAISGLVLMHFRVTSFDMLLHTRFGILLLLKISLFLLMVLTAAFVVLVIGPRLKRQRKGGGAVVPTGELTPEELALCDGKEGRPAYFAFRGKIYDASASKLWKEGVHMGRHHAGEDLTEVLKLAPHGAEQVTALPLVGDLVAEGTQMVPWHLRVFYAMAYFNLSSVFVIVFIVALWRWW